MDDLKLDFLIDGYYVCPNCGKKFFKENLIIRTITDSHVEYSKLEYCPHCFYKWTGRIKKRNKVSII